MVLFFGPNWAIMDTCSECRAKNIIGIARGKDPEPEKIKAYLGLAPKLLGLEPAQIKEWFVPKAVRRAARDKSYAYDYRKKYDIYITDGKRFWQWRNFPHLMNDYLTCEKFKETHTSWEVLTLEGTQGSAFSHIAC